MVPGAFGEQPAPNPNASRCTRLPIDGFGRVRCGSGRSHRGSADHVPVRVHQCDTLFIDQAADFLHRLTRLRHMPRVPA